MENLSSYLIASESIVPIRSAPADSSEMVSQLLLGEGCELQQHGQVDWIRIRAVLDSYEGWVDRKMCHKPVNVNENQEVIYYSGHSSRLNCKLNGGEEQRPVGYGFCISGTSREKGIFSMSDDFNIQLSDSLWKPVPQQLLGFIREFTDMTLGTPYLWGGKTVFGIDCSGLSQLYYRLLGIPLSRDASIQESEGIKVKFENRKVGDLAFFSNSQARVIHVGILVSQDCILHASGVVRLDGFEERGIRRRTDKVLTHKLYGIRRYGA